jgi:hypothetical protein
MAWANGADIQILNSAGVWQKILKPHFDTDAVYRVEPEKLKYRVALLKWYSHKVVSVYSSETDAECIEKESYFVRWLDCWKEYDDV